MMGSQFISLKRGSFWLSTDAIGNVELPSIRDFGFLLAIGMHCWLPGLLKAY